MNSAMNYSTDCYSVSALLSHTYSCSYGLCSMTTDEHQHYYDVIGHNSSICAHVIL